jgi:hypothetical protein
VLQPAGSEASVGDITYYAPWENLAIFYNDFGYASRLVILGKNFEDRQLRIQFQEITP